MFLPGKSQGLESLVSCHLLGYTESDMTERLYFHFSLSGIGEGNGNPHQCSCLENPRDGGAWWAAVYGVTQSWTQLKRLSSSSSSNTLLYEYAVFYLQVDGHFGYNKVLLLLLLLSRFSCVQLCVTP